MVAGHRRAPVVGQIRQQYAAVGFENGRLGFPTGDEVCGIKDGGCYQEFQGGVIIWSPTTGAHASWGAIGQRYRDLRGVSSSLGLPTGNEVCGIRDGGCYQNYQAGAIVWSPSGGAWESTGAIRARWRQLGFESSALGYPTGTISCDEADGRCQQRYQGGSIVEQRDHSTVAVRGSAADPAPVPASVTTDTQVTVTGKVAAGRTVSLDVIGSDGTIRTVATTTAGADGSYTLTAPSLAAAERVRVVVASPTGWVRGEWSSPSPAPQAAQPPVTTPAPSTTATATPSSPVPSSSAPASPSATPTGSARPSGSASPSATASGTP